jgi:predicted Zn finger-like uncharacterized protein
MFKVVQDQLRISEGWVRCGYCDEVFDANAHLQSNVVPQAQAVVLEETHAVEQGIDDVPQSSIPADAVAQDAPLADGASVATTVLTSEPELIESAQALPPEMDMGLSFMHKSCNSSGRYAKAVSFFWGFCGLVLMGLLCVQVVVQERDRLAAVEPQLSPLLVSLCEVLNCQLAPLRQIESLVIESSSFVNVRGATYRLNVTLKNTASIALALPAVELTLTDLQDQAVMRRVMLARDFERTAVAIAGWVELQTSFPVNVKMSADTDKFSGYRLVIFYP